MSMTINNLAANYAYQNAGQLRPALDKNNDGVWSKQEVGRFADDYKSVTGNGIDVDKLFETYDADSNGVLGAAEYEKVYEDDALGMSALLNSQTEDTPAAYFESSGEDMASWLDSMSSLRRTALTKATFMAEQTGSLLNSMMPQNNMLSTLTYAISQYDSAKSYAELGRSSLSSLFETQM